MKRFLNSTDIAHLAAGLSNRILYLSKKMTEVKLYGVPRGGVPVAYALQRYSEVFTIVDHPREAHIIVDDIIDSGATYDRYGETYPATPFLALIDKTEADLNPYGEDWIVFPWEAEDRAVPETIENNVIRILQLIGEDPTREGLKETPVRVAKAWAYWSKGYGQDAGVILKAFTDGAEHCDEMVMVKDIPFYSKCEHHLADIFGTVTIAYIPNGRIVGLSKLSRLVDMFARRLQVQERLTNQIADSLVEHLQPLGVGVIVKARHMCMESRGICQQGHMTITSALRGVVKDTPQARSEFLKLAE